MRLVSKRIHLRPLSMADCTALYVAWLNDPGVNRYLETRHVPQTLERVREFVAGVNARDDEHLLGIFLDEGDRHIGNIKVGPVSCHHLVADVSLFIGEQGAWGYGYATEAIVTVSRFAFTELGVRKLAAGMYAPNQASYKAFLKAGYKPEGLRRKHYLLGEEMCDILEVGLLPEDLA